MRWMTWVVPTVLVLAIAPGLMARSKPTPAQKCAAAKMKAMSKKTSGLFACYAKAAASGAAVDAGCVAKVSGKFAVTFAKIDAKGGCAVTGDAAAVEAQIDDAVSALVSAAPTEPTTTSSSTSTSTSTTTSTSLPPCTTEGAPGCGPCGTSVCARHCPGSTLACFNNSTGTSMACSSDTDCPAGQRCAAVGANCGAGGSNNACVAGTCP